MDDPIPLPLEPLPYHRDIIRHLRRREPDLWSWFAADRLRAERGDEARLELLKRAYRIERGDGTGPGGALYAAADEVAARLGLAVPLTVYQSQGAVGLNASLSYIPGEVHVVLDGPVASALSPAEVRGVLGHELLHFLLLDRWPEFRTAARLLPALASDAAAVPPHFASARLFGLHAEVYCDRGAFLASGDLGAAVSSLVKLETGIADISPESYLRQADEIFRKGHPKAEGVTHPETFIRARALQLWTEDRALPPERIAEVIEGPPTLEGLDLLGQERTSALTRRLIAAFLRPAWLRTETNLAHARLFFDDFAPGGDDDPDLPGLLDRGDEKLRDYHAAVLLDFAAADRDLEEAPLAAALLLADRLGLGERLRRLATRELGIRKRALESLEARAQAAVTAAAAAAGEEER